MKAMILRPLKVELERKLKVPNIEIDSIISDKSNLELNEFPETVEKFSEEKKSWKIDRVLIKKSKLYLFFSVFQDIFRVAYYL